MSSQRGSDPPARIFCHDYDEDDYSDENESATRTNDRYHYHRHRHSQLQSRAQNDHQEVKGQDDAVKPPPPARNAVVGPSVRCLEAEAASAAVSVSPHYKDQVRPLCRDDKRRVTAPNLVSSTNNIPTAVANVCPIAPTSASSVVMAVAVPMSDDEPPYRAEIGVLSGNSQDQTRTSYINDEYNNGPAQAATLAADTQAAAALEAVAPDQASATMKDETSPMDDDDNIRETSEQNDAEVERQRRLRSAERFRMSATRIKMLYIQKSKQSHRRPSRQHMVATTLWEDENDGGDSDIDVGTGRSSSSKSANVDWKLPMRSMQDTSQHNYDDFGGHDAKIGRLVEI